TVITLDRRSRPRLSDRYRSRAVGKCRVKSDNGPAGDTMIDLIRDDRIALEIDIPRGSFRTRFLRHSRSATSGRPTNERTARLAHINDPYQVVRVGERGTVSLVDTTLGPGQRDALPVQLRRR